MACARAAGGVSTSLLIYVLTRFAFLVLGITLPLPCGVFAPCLAIGAGIGRSVHAIFAATGHASADAAGGYAVLGAASMAAGATRTISSAILLFELVDGITHVLPVLISVIVAYVIGEVGFCVGGWPHARPARPPYARPPRPPPTPAP